MSDINKFLEKLRSLNFRTDPKEDYNNYGSIGHLEIEFPDHTQFTITPQKEWEDLCLEIRKEK